VDAIVWYRHRQMEKARFPGRKSDFIHYSSVTGRIWDRYIPGSVKHKNAAMHVPRRHDAYSYNYTSAPSIPHALAKQTLRMISEVLFISKNGKL
jgi:hypothetical protein